MSSINIKRVYDQAAATDGFRVLVDRLWPRGVSKEKAKVDLWLKEIAPSAELREWFGHDPAKFSEFQKRYEAELRHNGAVEELAAILREHPTATLLFAAKDTEHNNAVVLEAFLQDKAS